MGTTNRGGRAARSSLEATPASATRSELPVLRAGLDRRLAEASEPEERADVLLQLGALALRRGHLDGAIAFSTEARGLFLETGRTLGAAEATAQIGLAAALVGDGPRAREAFAGALGADDDGGRIGDDDPELEARLLLLAADAAYATDDVERARHAWERARAHFESYWNGAALARIYAGLALIGAAETNPGSAPRLLASRALEEAETADDPLALGRACLAEAVVVAGSDPGAAASWAVRAARAFDEHGLDRELAETCLRWGSLAPDDADALPWLLRAEELFRALGTGRDVERARIVRRRREAGGHRADEIRQAMSSLRPGRHPPAPAGSGGMNVHSANDTPYARGMNVHSAWERLESGVSGIIEERQGWRLLAEALIRLANEDDRALLPLEIARHAARLVGADRAVVALVDADGRAQLVGAARMPEDDTIWRQPVAAVVAIGGGPELFFSDEGPADRELHAGRALACPMTYAGRALGALYCDRVPSGGMLTERELELVTLLAGVAAARLGAHLLAAELERSDRRGDALLAAAAEGLTVIDNHGRIEGWNRPAARLLGLGDEARMHRAPSQSMPAIGGWPALAVLAEPGAEEVDDALLLLPGGAARVRSRRLRGDGAEPGGVVLALHPIGEVAAARVRLDDVVAAGPLLKRRLRTAEAAARGHGPVLICGEPGTGRRLFARAIAGMTSEAPAVIVEGRAVADGHGLFGTPLRPGLVEQAGPVPLVLVDADELEPEVAGKLFETLAKRGAARLFVTARRPIADLARPLPRDARERLAALTIELPPLRERPEEIAALAEHLLERIAARLGRPVVPGASPELLDALRGYAWPGNVAELERLLAHEVERAPADLDVLYEVPAEITGAPEAPAAGHGRSIADAERQLLIQALRQHRGNVPRVARTLGVSKGTVYNMMRKYRIDPASYRVSS